MAYQDEDRFIVATFSRSPEGGETVIGLPERRIFVALPPAAVDVLDWLAAGANAGEARRRYRDRYGEPIDLNPFLDAMASRGFLAPAAEDATTIRIDPAPSARAFSGGFDRLAAAFFGRTALSLYAAVISAGGLLLAAEPALLPDWRAFAFDHHLLLLLPALMLIDLLGTLVHESAHVLAARSRGVVGSLGVGHRLWILVAETDLTGLWALPRRQRFLPVLAGPLVDAVSAALVILVLAAADGGLFQLPDLAVQVLEATLLLYGLRLLWQCYFFLRTDFYYVLVFATGCKNLLGDTVAWLRNAVARLLPFVGRVDLSHIDRREMRIVRTYAAVWLAGRALALYLLFVVVLPVAWHYVKLLAAGLTAGTATGESLPPATLVPIAFSLLVLVGGLVMWMRSLFRKAMK